MGKAVQVLYCLLLMLGVVTGQAGSVGQRLPNWLTGIIAVAVFLFLAFITFLVNKAWCEDSSNSQEEKVTVTENEYSMNITNLDSVRSQEYDGAYENAIIHKSEENVTAM
ncbi:hypothetical protein AMELA_G00137160 [Ameiurus melas]|uniref:PDZK1-interacting protein 1 n=1 Tax=Ameiurus melas TaxID=219545 RepID=A0A7J6AJZ6_AMEME|nr:hypothetical protein AMELA_G00137160 [Ameiurus melas]